MSSLHLADAVLALLLLLAILYGWRWGTINVVAQVGSLVLAYQVARGLSAVIAQGLVKIIPPFGGSTGQAGGDGGILNGILSLFIDTGGAANRLLEIIVFVVVFLLVNWLVRKIAHMLTGVFGRGLLGTVNKAIGAAVALLLMLAIMVIVIDIVLPACIKMGFGSSVLAFFNKSGLLMPFIMELAQIIN